MLMLSTDSSVKNFILNFNKNSKIITIQDKGLFNYLWGGGFKLCDTSIVNICLYEIFVKNPIFDRHHKLTTPNIDQKYNNIKKKKINNTQILCQKFKVIPLFFNHLLNYLFTLC